MIDFIQVLVVGSGIAGTAAALTAARAGARVTCIGARPGASALTSGACDDAPWFEAARALGPRALDAATTAVLEDLGGYAMASSPALLLATTGLLRPAIGRERALLDLRRLPAGLVLVAATDHPGWDATSIARSANASAAARARGFRFEARPIVLIRHLDELFAPDRDLAARHDDDARLAWLVARLRDALGPAPSAVGLVLPPWLGLKKERAGHLSEALGLPCGEALGDVGGPAGARFEHRRDEAFTRAGVTSLLAHVTHLREQEDDVEVTLSSGETLRGDAVVVATGGPLGGGLVYGTRGLEEGALPQAAFRAGFESPLVVGEGGEPLATASTLFGASPERFADPRGTFESVGFLTEASGRARGQRSIFVAGDAREGLPRTWLAAASTGARAGAEAAAQRTNGPRA